MKIPESALPRQDFVSKVLEQCMATMEERGQYYRTLRQWYLYGHDGTMDNTAVVNKIYPHVDQVGSFLYSQDTTRFTIEVGKSVSDIELGKVPPLSDAVNDSWHSSNTDILYGNALDWSLVYGTMFIKPRWNRDGIQPFIVEPHNVGVYREDIIGLSRQEAFVHQYLIPQSQLEHELTVANHKDIDHILSQANYQMQDLVGSDTGPNDSVIASAISPEIVGEVSLNLNAIVRYLPKVVTPMARMYELYVFDNEINDYRVFTMAHPWVMIYDRPIDKLFLANDVPLIQISPWPVHDYFWGISAVERLMPLQSMRNRRWTQVQHLLDLQASPPKSGVGLSGDADEIGTTLDSPGGMVLSDPGSEIKSLPPEMPPDLFAELNYIDQMFDDYTGTTNVLSGKGEAGVRSENHANALLRVGSSRVKRRAMVVEDSLEELATTYLQILKKYCDKTYRSDDGTEFLANQFTDDFVVKVDAHSNSPIFAQDVTQMAELLFKAKAIDRETLIDMLPVPTKDLLKSRLRNKIEPAEAQAKQAELKAEAEGNTHKRK